MAASAPGAAPRQPRRGPAPFASFDHDVSDESSPESKQTFQLPEIREDPAATSPAAGGSSAASGDDGAACLAPPEQRARSHSTPTVQALQTPAAPRIDISRASSSSHHDSRDSSPELALFAGTENMEGGEEARGRLELGFREDGALDLRSSTEELAFLEGAPGEARAQPGMHSTVRRHSRKDSQSSEIALLGVSGRTSRLSSVGSQCSAQSALSGFSHASRVSRLSVVSAISRSPSPHKMLLETSFCGPKPIETDPEICAAVVEEHLLERAKINAGEPQSLPVVTNTTSTNTGSYVDTSDRREVRTEVTVENASCRPASAARAAVTAPQQCSTSASSHSTTTSTDTQVTVAVIVAEDKRQKENKNRAKVEERRARSRERRAPSEPEVYKSANRTKNIIRIKLKPDDEYDDHEDGEEIQSDQTLRCAETMRKPETLDLGERNKRPARLAELVGHIEPATASPPPSPSPPHRRTPSPAGAAVSASRKSSFCSLFKSRETIASPDSPSNALRRKKSFNEGRSRSKSRDRSATPTSANKIKGSMLSLFKTPRKSATSPSPSSRDGSPVVQTQRQLPSHHVETPKRGEKLKYYEDTKDGIIHIPLRTPPDEKPGTSDMRTEADMETRLVQVTTHQPPGKIVSTSHHSSTANKPVSPATSGVPSKPIHRTVLPDGSIIIPLHSPTEKTVKSSVMESKSNGQSAADNTGHILEKSKENESISAEIQNVIATESTIASTVNNGPKSSQEEISSPKENTDDVRTAVQESVGNIDRWRKKERIVFMTHVGSQEQVFSTQFSITKTPSVTSEISESFANFQSNEECNTIAVLRDTHIATEVEPVSPSGSEQQRVSEASTNNAGGVASSREGARDSSDSEAGSECGGGGCEAEQRGLVVQESFEEELPYVPTTLPLERPAALALPMVPVRERAPPAAPAPLQRPRAAAPLPPGPPRAPPPLSPVRPPADKIHIRLPQTPRGSVAAPPAARTRTLSGGEAIVPSRMMSPRGSRTKADWIDFEEVPERRKQPKRIQTLPAGVAGAAGAGDAHDAVFSYVEPEHCRCECHHAGDAPRQDDELPLLHEHRRVSSSSLECGEERDEGGAEADGDSENAARQRQVRSQKHAHTEPERGQASRDRDRAALYCTD